MLGSLCLYGVINFLFKSMYVCRYEVYFYIMFWIDACFIGLWYKAEIEVIEAVVMEIESASETETWRGLVKRAKTS